MERTPNPEIVRQIAVLNPKLYPRWNPEWQKWMIVSDFPRHVEGITEYDPLAAKHYVIELTLEDEKGQAIELDNRVIETIYKSMREKERFYGPDGFSAEKFCADMDQAERIRFLRARKFRDEATTELFKKLWKLEHQLLFTYGGTL